MISLEKISGLKLTYDSKKNRLLSPDVIINKQEIRKLKDMKFVFMKNTSFKKDLSAYYMYRNLYRKDHKYIFSKNKFRWDITIIPPRVIGKEFIKTLGHHHKGIEIYEVLYGEALYIFENKKDFLVIHAKAGSRVYVPYEYWHITINPTNKLLIMANLMPDKIKSNYKDIQKKHGMAYYYIKGNKFIPNLNYKKLPEIKISKAKKFKESIYWEFIDNPKKFRLK